MTEFRYYAVEETRVGDSVVYFDMDGTVADLYAVDGWLDMLCNHDTYPYENAELMIDYNVLCDFIDTLHSIGWKVGILSWLSKDPTPEYDEAVINAKLAWLDANFPPVDEIAIIPHGTPKYESIAPAEAILIDDEALNRLHWDASGPLRRSYPADEIDDLTQVLSASAIDAASGESDLDDNGITTAEELVETILKRMLFCIGDEFKCPLIELVNNDDMYYLQFYNCEGTAYYVDYDEYVIPLKNPDCLTQDEIDQTFAKADRLIYDIA